MILTSLTALDGLPAPWANLLYHSAHAFYNRPMMALPVDLGARVWSTNNPCKGLADGPRLRRAKGLDRAYRLAFVSHQALDGKVRSMLEPHHDSPSRGDLLRKLPDSAPGGRQRVVEEI